jgi:hypothetical protein
MNTKRLAAYRAEDSTRISRTAYRLEPPPERSMPFLFAYLWTCRILATINPVVYKVMARDMPRNGILNLTRGARPCEAVTFVINSAATWPAIPSPAQTKIFFRRAKREIFEDLLVPATTPSMGRTTTSHERPQTIQHLHIY